LIIYIIKGSVLKLSSKFYASGGNVAWLNKVAKKIRFISFIYFNQDYESGEREKERIRKRKKKKRKRE
jgi:hypothetical protein